MITLVVNLFSGRLSILICRDWCISFPVQLSDQCSKQEKLIKELQARVMTLDATVRDNLFKITVRQHCCDGALIFLIIYLIFKVSMASNSNPCSFYMQNSELSEANTNLTHNISSLFNTAKLEIERKDNEIKELREKIAQIEQRSSSARAQQDSRTPSDRQQPQHAQQPYHGQREDRSHSRGRDKDRGQRSDRDRDLKKEHDPREERPRHGSMDRRGSGHGGTREERSSERERDMRRGR